MAYFRTSMLSTSNITDQNNGIYAPESDVSKIARDDNEKSKEDVVKPLTLFSIDMSHLSPVVQYFILASGLIIFMCLYGYYQELVVYGWFERKLSMFSTFLHFFGCLLFAQLQRNLSRGSSKAPAASISGNHIAPSSNFMVFTMGTAPPRVAIFYYCLLIFVRTGAQGMSNLSMTQINYPAKVLFKSATPIVTMIIGLLWFKKTYPMRDYIVVALLVCGLYVFITGDATASPQSTKLGIFYVVLSMFGSAGIPMIQEHCMVTYNSSIEDLLYHTFLGSAIASFLTSCLTGEMWQGIMFLVRTGSVHAWFIMFAFTIFGFVGTNFSAGLTLQYGSLVNSVTNTFRKALTLGLSFLLFPERNLITNQKLLGSLIFFSGLIVRIFSKAGVKPAYKDHEKLVDIEAGMLRSATTIVENKSKTPSLSAHTTYFGNNASTDFGQLLASTDEPLDRETGTGTAEDEENSYRCGGEDLLEEGTSLLNPAQNLVYNSSGGNHSRTVYGHALGNPLEGLFGANKCDTSAAAATTSPNPNRLVRFAFPTSNNNNNNNNNSDSLDGGGTDTANTSPSSDTQQESARVVQELAV